MAAFQLKDAFLANLKQRILTQLIQPYCQSEASFSVIEDNLSLDLIREAERLDTLSNLTGYLKDRLPVLLNLLQPLLFELIITEILYPSLKPSTSDEDLQAFQALLSRAISFEASLTAKGPISRWSESLSLHWIRKVNEQVSLSIRNLVVEAGSSKGWDSKQVEWRSDCLQESPFSPPKPIVATPQQSPVRSRKVPTNGENGWDFDGDIASSPEASTSKASPIHEAADAWELDSSPIKVDEEGWGIDEPPAIDADGDGWGFDVPSSPEETKAQWGWTDESPTKPRAKRKLGAVPISQLPVDSPRRGRSPKPEDKPDSEELNPQPAELPIEHLSVSLHVDKLLGLAQEVIDRAKTVAAS